MLCGLLPVYTALWCEQCDLLAVMWQAIWTGSYLEQGLMCAGPFPATFPEVMSDVPLAATVMTLLFSLWEKGNTKKGLSLQGWVVYLQVEDLTFSFSFFSDCQEDTGPLGTGPLDTSNIKEHLNLCLLELDSVPTLLTLLLGEERRGQFVHDECHLTLLIHQPCSQTAARMEAGRRRREVGRKSRRCSG